MKFLHTSDWHLGQTFYEYSRYEEHKFFLEWLSDVIGQQQVDVLLITGDIFDTSNPSVESTTLFYRFLNTIVHRYPYLQVVAIAGNHDSPVRLEMPKPFLDQTYVHLIGHVRKNEDKTINYQDLIIPLYNKNKEIEHYCLSVPFLRLGDYPKSEDGTFDYAQGITAFYSEIVERAFTIKNEAQGLIALGHLHVAGAEVTEEDTAERAIMGGVEVVNVNQFSKDLSYIALGHIHKAQKLGGKDHIRYSGSPIPLSFSERHYKHQVVVFELISSTCQNIKIVEIPQASGLISLPAKHDILDQVLKKIQELPTRKNDAGNAPFLEVRVLLNEPLPDLKYTIQQAVSEKNVRLARIDVKLKKAEIQTPGEENLHEIELSEVQPIHIFQKIYEKKFQEPLPEVYEAMFNEVLSEINHQTTEEL